MARFLWTKKEDFGPSPRFGHAMSYDLARRRVVLFGGEFLGGESLNDTWEWDGEHWTQMADIGPPARHDHAMAYDTARLRTVLFGGVGEVNFGDTWEWNGEDWTQVTNAGPSARFRHAIAFDSARKRTVLFGGVSATAPLADTWEFDGVEWTQQEDVGPPARQRHGVAYDVGRGRTVLFGGDIGDGLGFNDTWEWNGTAWRQMADFGPEPCSGPALVFKGDHVALFGGVDSVTVRAVPRVLHDTWEWDGKHWTHRQDIGPGPRLRHAMAYDSARNRVVLFGGFPSMEAFAAEAALGDTWEGLDPGVVPAAPPIQPSALKITEMSISPTTVFIGRPVAITVLLSGPAPAEGLVVQIVAHLSELGHPGPAVEAEFLSLATLTIPASTTSTVEKLDTTRLLPGSHAVFAILQTGGTLLERVSQGASATLTITFVG